MISVERVSKLYGAFRALHQVSFQVERGTIVGLLGLNGAGKTTALRVLAGLTVPSEGTVRIEGLDLLERPEEARALIGYAPDTPPLYGEMTVRGYLELAARLRGLGREEATRRVAALEEKLGLGEVRGKRIAGLSHGTKQRVGLAQAIVHRPALVLLDEPTTGLDPAQLVEVRSLIRALRTEHTVLLSSHLLAEVSLVCDRVLLLHQGEIHAQGTIAELAERLERQVVLVRVRGPAGPPVVALRALEGVQAVEVTTAESSQTELRVKTARDIRPEIARALMDAKLDILRLDRLLALESIFLEALPPAAGPQTPVATK